MLQKFTRPCKWVLPVLFVLFSTALLYGGPQMGVDRNAPEQTITGCLQKGMEPVGFFIINTDGKHWELYPSGQLSFADHVGQTVTVTGFVAHRSPTQEEKSQPYEKQEMGTRQHSDLQVSTLKVVSQGCSK